MTFDPTPFTTNLDHLRDLWMEAQGHLCGRYQKDRGFVNSASDNDGHRPTWHAGGTWEAVSNHQKVIQTSWIARVRASFELMDANLRSIPASILLFFPAYRLSRWQ